jgi:alpha-L-arabinofuranosidase
MNRIKIVLLYTSSLLGLTAHAEKTTVTGHVNARKPISPDLVGIFFEDLNSAADGRLYAEWVQNRSFEYQATEQPNMGSLTLGVFSTRRRCCLCANWNEFNLAI